MAKSTVVRRRKVRQLPVLVVEDNADQWLIIRSVLTQCFPEVEPVWVNNVDQAIRYLETQSAGTDKSPWLIIADLYLPRKEDGWQLLEFHKNHTFHQKPPIIVLSSSQEREDIVKVYSYSVASYIVKPATYHEWLTSFYAFRRYWWELVVLPAHEQSLDHKPHQPSGQ